VCAFIARAAAARFLVSAPGAIVRAMPVIGPESRHFAGLCLCETSSTWGLGERAGWQCWECPDRGANHDLDHVYDERPVRILGRLPPDAQAMGLHMGATSLWLSPSNPRAIYLKKDSRIQRLPQQLHPFGCA